MANKQIMKSKAEKAKEMEAAQAAPEAKKTKREIVAKVRGKNYQETKAKIDHNKNYTLAEAIKFFKENKDGAKFDQTLELHMIVKKIGLNVNANLPHSSGKEKKVEVADDATLKKLDAGKVDFDVLLATADMMPKLVKYARILGPKGMMPNPKNGTLIKSTADAKNFSGNSKTIKTEKEAPLIHTSFGKVSQNEKELVENADVILDAVNRKQIVRVFMKSTMSPSLKVQI
ncbi:MAG TPA: hypothetical protein VG895_00900 [Patescibacteria group bacterium]|nr:hypothetical protein [Patescibacteria group bacterium]